MPLHRKGWHPTAVLGPIAAAAACAKLRGLDAERSATAMAIAASMASGLVANFGTMTKSFQVGRAAQSGADRRTPGASRLTASLDALEHQAGLLVALSPDGKPDRDRPFVAAQKEWHIVDHGLTIKRYPICYATHRSIDAALDLVERHDLIPGEVERIHVSTGKTQMLMLRNSAPQTGLEAKFSMQFAMAAALVARHVGLRELTDDFVRRARGAGDVPARVARRHCGRQGRLQLRAFRRRRNHDDGGETLKSGPVEYAKGSHERPLSRDELWAKFAECLGAEFPDAKKSRAFENLMMFDRLNGAGDLGLQSV